MVMVEWGGSKLLDAWVVGENGSGGVTIIAGGKSRSRCIGLSSMRLSGLRLRSSAVQADHASFLEMKWLRRFACIRR